MTIVQARNAIVLGLENHIGCPVVPSEQTVDMPPYPFCCYSILASRITKYTFGLEDVVKNPDKSVHFRSEPVSATMSLNICSMNRETEDGGYIFGEDEALELAEKAHGFFLLDAHNISSEFGDIVIKNIGSVSNRTGFLVEDYVHRYGFDIRFSYVRTDEMSTTTVLDVGNPKGNLHQ